MDADYFRGVSRKLWIPGDLPRQWRRFSSRLHLQSAPRSKECQGGMVELRRVGTVGQHSAWRKVQPTIRGISDLGELLIMERLPLLFPESHQLRPLHWSRIAR